jgi:ABC-type glycerol-3-phosphate transport system substrate-binding protein
MRSNRLLMAGLALAGLAACGGGNDRHDVPADTVPPIATSTPTAFTQYLGGLPEEDRREPLKVEGLVPPTSETAEPLPVTR